MLVGKIGGSTSMICASSIHRVNTTRKMVFPKSFDEDYLTGRQKRFITDVALRQKSRNDERKKELVPCLSMNKNMMQGINAMNAAVVNTLYCEGWASMQTRLAPKHVKGIILKTTSDDVNRTLKGHACSNSKWKVKSWWVDMPNNYLYQSMMQPNNDKAIESSKIAEFNNVAVIKDGMISQGLVHSSLCIQP
jgi:hypothetical protein